jgi:hypothetical protein
MGSLKNEEFCTILEMIDRWLPYYPLYGPNENTVPQSLTEDEKIEILDNVKKVEWLPIMGMRGQYPFQFQSYDELKDFYTELEDAVEVQQEVAKHGKSRELQQQKEAFRRPQERSRRSRPPRATIRKISPAVIAARRVIPSRNVGPNQATKNCAPRTRRSHPPNPSKTRNRPSGKSSMRL